MKKRRMTLLACCFLICFTCVWMGARTEEEKEEGYALYFLERDLQAAAGGGALRVESTLLPEAESMSTQLIAQNLVQRLLDGPMDETLRNAIPQGTTLLSLNVEGTRAIVDFSAAYGTLSGMALTLADQALTMTLTQLPEILTVKITVRGRDLAYRDKQVFAARDVLLAPEGDVVGTVQVALYFPNQEGRLMPEERVLELYEGDTQVSAVAQAVENGPESRDLFEAFPEGFRVRSVWQEEGTCYVNLSSGLLETLPSDASLAVALQALAQSLGSLETVEEIRFLVDGEFAKQYGSVYVANPYLPWK